MAIQFLRGTTAENDTYVGPVGSITIDTESNAIRVHDGVTPGGFVSSGEEQDLSDYLQKASNLSDVASAATAFNNIKQNATTSSAGVVEQATTAEAQAGAAGKFPDAAGVQA